MSAPASSRASLALAVVCAALAVFMTAPSIRAGEVLVFDDGRELVVAGWEIRDDVLHLDLPGGGALAIPAEGIEGVRRLPERDEGPPELSESWKQWAGEFAVLFEEAADRHRVEPVLLAAMARIESNFNAFAVSPKGACGMLQLIPETAERFGVEDVFNASENIDGGARYLRWLLERFDGDTRLALAAYNAGESAVQRYGGIPPYRETQDYVRKVLGKVDLFSTSMPVERVASVR